MSVSNFTGLLPWPSWILAQGFRAGRFLCVAARLSTGRFRRSGRALYRPFPGQNANSPFGFIKAGKMPALRAQAGGQGCPPPRDWRDTGGRLAQPLEGRHIRTRVAVAVALRRERTVGGV
jgi:hypothetical protein